MLNATGNVQNRKVFRYCNPGGRGSGRVWEGVSPGFGGGLDRAATEFGPGFAQVWGRPLALDRGSRTWTLDIDRVLLLTAAREGGAELADRFEYFRQ